MEINDICLRSPPIYLSGEYYVKFKNKNKILKRSFNWEKRVVSVLQSLEIKDVYERLLLDANLEDVTFRYNRKNREKILHVELLNGLDFNGFTEFYISLESEFEKWVNSLQYAKQYWIKKQQVVQSPIKFITGRTDIFQLRLNLCCGVTTDIPAFRSMELVELVKCVNKTGGCYCRTCYIDEEQAQLFAVSKEGEVSVIGDNDGFCSSVDQEHRLFLMDNSKPTRLLVLFFEEEDTATSFVACTAVKNITAYNMSKDTNKLPFIREKMRTFSSNGEVSLYFVNTSEVFPMDTQLNGDDRPLEYIYHKNGFLKDRTGKLVVRKNIGIIKSLTINEEDERQLKICKNEAIRRTKSKAISDIKQELEKKIYSSSPTASESSLNMDLFTIHGNAVECTPAFFNSGVVLELDSSDDESATSMERYDENEQPNIDDQSGTFGGGEYVLRSTINNKEQTNEGVNQPILGDTKESNLVLDEFKEQKNDRTEIEEKEEIEEQWPEKHNTGTDDLVIDTNQPIVDLGEDEPIKPEQKFGVADNLVNKIPEESVLAEEDESKVIKEENIEVTECKENNKEKVRITSSYVDMGSTEDDYEALDTTQLIMDNYQKYVFDSVDEEKKPLENPATFISSIVKNENIKRKKAVKCSICSEYVINTPTAVRSVHMLKALQSSDTLYLCFSGVHLRKSGQQWSIADNCQVQSGFTDTQWTTSRPVRGAVAVNLGEFICLFVPGNGRAKGDWIVRQVVHNESVNTKKDEMNLPEEPKEVIADVPEDKVVIEQHSKSFSSSDDEEVIVGSCLPPITHLTPSKYHHQVFGETKEKMKESVLNTMKKVPIIIKKGERMLDKMLTEDKPTVSEVDNVDSLARAVLKDEFVFVEEKYVKPLKGIISNICTQMEKVDMVKQRELGDDFLNKNIGWKIRGDLCTILAQLFWIGIKDEQDVLKSLFGKQKEVTQWDVVHEFAMSFKREEFYSVLRCIANARMRTDDEKFRAFFCELLNRSKVDGSEKLIITFFQMFPFISNKLEKFYCPGSFWRMTYSSGFGTVLDEIILSLKHLNGWPFNLHLDFERRFCPVKRPKPQRKMEGDSLVIFE